MSPELASLKQFLEPYPTDVQDLTLAARKELLELLGPISELFYDATAAVCVGFAYEPTMKNVFVNLAVYSNHVTIIFPWGVRLQDPEKRLKGEGNQVRNIRMDGIETLRDPYVIELIRQAEAAAPRPERAVEPTQIVKIYNGPKRRPIGKSALP